MDPPRRLVATYRALRWRVSSTYLNASGLVASVGYTVMDRAYEPVALSEPVVLVASPVALYAARAPSRALNRAPRVAGWERLEQEPSNHLDVTRGRLRQHPT